MSYPVTTALLTNTAYGYPSRGAARRVRPKVLICIHITGNSHNLGATAATNERNYANRAGSTGPSAHDYINRDGSVVHAIDTKYAAWSNGIMRSPKPIALVATVQSFVAGGYNANEAYVREVECVGYGSSYPITTAQKETLAQMIASDARTWSLPISRATVGQHSDLDTINRPNCAGLAETALAQIIGRAQWLVDEAAITAARAKLDAAKLDATYLGSEGLAALQARIAKAKADLA